MNTQPLDTASLVNALADFQRSWNAKAPEGLQDKFENGINEIKSLNKTALNLGDRVPDFELKNALNKPVKLSALLQDGPVVLTWYRGGWCPYCNIQLRYLQSFLPQFKAAGATLVALSPELPDRSLDTTEKNNLEFEVLTDHNNEVARQFRIAFTLNDELIEIYNDFHKLETYNGVATNELPVPATYVIGTNGIIKYAFVDADYRKRAEPAEILEVLKNL
ncbi:AhpC/TSA family protein [Mucilaginibacter achroorhodeus]|uniref:thioredoxin-dependent peroxiredoxin n=1 Tax=Mucilaginibacter achroorhodeus TaxID=2599294 RepID=A0A563U5T8_9SPHI|nr:peroxiredoxin-like family protein [Mucilaginibacter achroorhodeus]TWR26727.1 AhpC/TSA family protein [Mucilaginibacter achroorhodeus]